VNIRHCGSIQRCYSEGHHGGGRAAGIGRAGVIVTIAESKCTLASRLESKHTRSCNSSMSLRSVMRFSVPPWGRNGWEGLVLCRWLRFPIAVLTQGEQNQLCLISFKQTITNQEKITHPSASLVVQRLRNKPDKLRPGKHTARQWIRAGADF
jgi:hypothetical protein